MTARLPAGSPARRPSRPRSLKARRMRSVLHHLDAFTTRPLGGNPAAVIVLSAWPSDAMLRCSGSRSEPLCHGLSRRHPAKPRIAALHSHSRDWTRGARNARRRSCCARRTYDRANRRRPSRCETSSRSRPAETVTGSLSTTRRCRACGANRRRHSCGGSGSRRIRWLSPVRLRRGRRNPGGRAGPFTEMTELLQLDRGSTIGTAPGLDCDFVSRVFSPKLGLPEYPVCGTAHRIMVPYRAERNPRQVGISGRGRISARGDLLVPLRSGQDHPLWTQRQAVLQRTRHPGLSLRCRQSLH